MEGMSSMVAPEGSPHQARKSCMPKHEFQRAPLLIWNIFLSLILPKRTSPGTAICTWEKVIYNLDVNVLLRTWELHHSTITSTKQRHKQLTPENIKAINECRNLYNIKRYQISANKTYLILYFYLQKMLLKNITATEFKVKQVYTSIENCPILLEMTTWGEWC
jgi:hypothetical protein